jgi:uncharacterized RDD family membrane protein YckC
MSMTNPYIVRDPTAVMGRRVVAYLIDAVLAFAAIVIVLALSKHTTYMNAPTNACAQLQDAGVSGYCFQTGSRVFVWTGNAPLHADCTGLFVALVNYVVLQGLTGATVGKFLLGLRVVNGHGVRGGVGRSFVRWAFFLVDLFPYCLPVTGFATALSGHPRRRVGDRVAGTYVVARHDVGASPIAAPLPAMPYVPHVPPPAWAPPAAP